MQEGRIRVALVAARRVGIYYKSSDTERTGSSVQNNSLEINAALRGGRRIIICSKLAANRVLWTVLV